MTGTRSADLRLAAVTVILSRTLDDPMPVFAALDALGVTGEEIAAAVHIVKRIYDGAGHGDLTRDDLWCPVCEDL